MVAEHNRARRASQSDLLNQVGELFTKIAHKKSCINVQRTDCCFVLWSECSMDVTDNRKLDATCG